MVQLDLDPEELDTLVEVLESYLSDLRTEISHTDRAEFRDMLKARKAVLTKVIGALRRGGGP